MLSTRTLVYLANGQPPIRTARQSANPWSKSASKTREQLSCSREAEVGMLNTFRITVTQQFFLNRQTGILLLQSHGCCRLKHGCRYQTRIVHTIDSVDSTCNLHGALQKHVGESSASPERDGQKLYKIFQILRNNLQYFTFSVSGNKSGDAFALSIGFVDSACTVHIAQRNMSDTIGHQQSTLCLMDVGVCTSWEITGSIYKKPAPLIFRPATTHLTGSGKSRTNACIDLEETNRTVSTFSRNTQNHVISMWLFAADKSVSFFFWLCDANGVGCVFSDPLMQLSYTLHYSTDTKRTQLSHFISPFVQCS